MILYDSRPGDWNVSEVAKVCSVRNTPEHEFEPSSTSPSDWYFPQQSYKTCRPTACPASTHTLNSWARFPVSYRDCSAVQGEVIFPILGHETIDLRVCRDLHFPLVWPRCVEPARNSPGPEDFNGHGFFYEFGLQANVVQGYVSLITLYHVAVALRRTLLRSACR